uniref:Uncharacterized protein n=1 Tax=Leersia perrieri TaxID=77586 RepID=A0A0D9W2Z4_9ORYZ
MTFAAESLTNKNYELSVESRDDFSDFTINQRKGLVLDGGATRMRGQRARSYDDGGERKTKDLESIANNSFR